MGEYTRQVQWSTVLRTRLHISCQVLILDPAKLCPLASSTACSLIVVEIRFQSIFANRMSKSLSRTIVLCGRSMKLRTEQNCPPWVSYSKQFRLSNEIAFVLSQKKISACGSGASTCLVYRGRRGAVCLWKRDPDSTHTHGRTLKKKE